ncbi:hypothetical protein V5P93_000258 [Actinokineospora auranticolor]|uniref:Uncharacterized protein n=1 Tax=Actinokineospora auranticolor TaxID=155976 RepID=A0A2S6GKT8_9PSEU|nr:hypothetical protein [Actinokineospora auranticolor]PPK65852.1 hypothetical protein CLV40_112114 [Actinokineospora auranticolor]
MNKIARFVAASVAGSLLALGGAGMAQAETATDPVERIATVDSQLKQAVDTQDLAGVRTAINDLRTTLQQTADPRAAEADAKLAQVQQALPGLGGLPIPDISSLLGGVTGGAAGGLPVVGGLLGGGNPLSGLLQAVSNLLTGLLGGLAGGGSPLGGLGGLTSVLGGLPVVGGLLGSLGGATGGVTGAAGGATGGLGGLGGLLSGLPGGNLLGGLLGGLPLVGGLLGGGK